MADNVVSNPGSGGATFRAFSDGTVDWPANIAAYVTGGSAGSWTLQQVDATHGLPISVLGTVPVSGTFFQATQPVSIAATVGTSDAADGPVAAGAAAGKSILGGAQFNTTLPTLSTGQQCAVQCDTNGRLLIGSVSGTVTISGTVTANIGTTNGLALDTSVNGLLVSQGSTTSGEKGPLIQAAVTTAAPSYTTAQTSPLSLTTAGALRVDGSAVTQPVSGTVTANAGTGSFTVAQATASNLQAQVQGAAASGAAKAGNPVQIGGVFNTTQPTVTTGQAVEAQATARGAQIVATGVDTFTVTVGAALPTGANVIGAVTQSGSWTVTANAGTGTFNVADANLELAQASTTSGQKGPLIQAAVTTAAPSYTTAQTSPLSLNTSGGLRVDGSGVTQPVSGTVTANAGTGSFTVAQATAANLNATVTGTVTANLGTTQSDRTQSTGLTAAGTVAVATNGCGTATLALTGTGAGMSFTIQGLDASGAWNNIPAITPAGAVVTAGTALTANGVWVVPCAGWAQVRANLTAITSGTATFSWEASAGCQAVMNDVGLLLAQGSTTSGQQGPLMQAAVTTTTPVYTTGQTAPLSLNAAGGLRISGSTFPAANNSGGATPTHLISAASTNATSTKASAGNVYSVSLYNTNAAVRFVKFYDKASAPTVGTDTPVHTFGVPPSGSVNVTFPVGAKFALGIAFATTTLIADSDTTAVGLGDLAINFTWN